MAKRKAKTAKRKPPATPPNTLVAPPSKTDRDYEAQDAYRDLLRAEGHRGNKDLMKRVHAHHKHESAQAARALRLEGKRL